ncbi:MAG: hypothetical protein WCK52_11620 [Betaproteobacteria bacterium]|jgi:hypothetical protein
MKKTDLEKNKASAIANQMKNNLQQGKFGSNAGALNKKKHLKSNPLLANLLTQVDKK